MQALSRTPDMPGYDPPINFTAVQLLAALPSMPSRSAPLRLTLPWARRTASLEPSVSATGKPPWRVAASSAGSLGQAPMTETASSMPRIAGRVVPDLVVGSADGAPTASDWHVSSTATTPDIDSVASGGPLMLASLGAGPPARLSSQGEGPSSRPQVFRRVPENAAADERAVPTITIAMVSATPFMSGIGAAVWSAMPLGKPASCILDEDAAICPVCLDRYLPSRPAEGMRDRRPVIFPCGHGACADCASNVCPIFPCSEPD
jgi:hypothetical protein